MALGVIADTDIGFIGSLTFQRRNMINYMRFQRRLYMVSPVSNTAASLSTMRSRAQPSGGPSDTTPLDIRWILNTIAMYSI